MGVSLVAAAVSAAASYGAAYVAGTLAAYSFTAAFVTAFALSVVARVISPSKDNLSTGLGVTDKGRMQVIRSADQPRRVIYGEMMVSGTLVFAGTAGNTTADTPSVEFVTVAQAVPVGANTMILAQTAATRLGALNFDTSSTFTIVGDATVYTLSSAPSFVSTGDFVGGITAEAYGIAVSFTPTLVVSPAVGTATTLVAAAPVSAESQGGGNDYLYLVIALAGHACEEIGTVWFNDKPEYDAQFSDHYTINRHLGAVPQTADADLIAAFPGQWTAAHRLDGVTYVTVKLKWSATVWQAGIPNITAVTKGRKLYDPRDASTKWQNNWALSVRDYLTSADGLGCGSTEIDDASFIAAANVSDEAVALGQNASVFTADVTHQWLSITGNLNLIAGSPVLLTTTGTLPAGFSAATVYYGAWLGTAKIALYPTADDAKAGTNAVVFSGAGTGTHTATVTYVFTVDTGAVVITNDTRRIRSGDAVKVASTGTLPAGLSAVTTYYAMRRGNTGDQRLKLCTTHANAMAGTSPVSITDGGTGTHTISVVSQYRYTADGTFELSGYPQDILDGLVTAGAGMIVCQGGVWRCLAGAWRAPTTTITNSMLAGPIQVRARMPKTDLYNAVKGTYIDPMNAWQASDFVPLTNSTYVAQDNGETIWHDIVLPFTTDGVRAQRIGKILLEKSRQQITVSEKLNLSGLTIGAGDTVAVTNGQLGWTAKPFTVTGWSFDPSGVGLALQEEASTCYDWNLGDETTIDPAPDTTLSPVWSILSPTDVLAYQGISRDGATWHTNVTVRWRPPLDVRVVGYNLRARVSGGNWVFLATLVRDTQYQVDGVLPGSYDVSVQAMSNNGATSAWVQTSVTVLEQADLLGTFGLPSPTTAVLRLHWANDAAGNLEVDHARLTLTFDNPTFSAVPDAVVLCHAAFDHPNMIPIASGGTGSTLTIGNATESIIGQGATPILAGSTAARLVLRETNNPFTMGQPNTSRFWGQYDASEWRKAVSYDETGFTFDPPFNIAPTTGHDLNWAELDWFDERPELTRLGLLTALDENGQPTGPYEVVRWQGIDQSPDFQLIGVLRGQEGTTTISADGLHMLYYSAPGAGTTSETFPIADWRDLGGGTFQGDINVKFAVKQGQWIAPVTCALYKSVGTDLIRSALVPVTFGGAIE